MKKPLIDRTIIPTITKIDISGDTVSISWIALEPQSYQVYFSDELGDGENWLPVPGSYTVSDGIATQDCLITGGIKKRFFKVKTQ